MTCRIGEGERQRNPEGKVGRRVPRTCFLCGGAIQIYTRLAGCPKLPNQIIWLMFSVGWGFEPFCAFYYIFVMR